MTYGKNAGTLRAARYASLRNKAWVYLVALAALAAVPAQATTILVDSTADDTATNGNCTLREAVLAANLNLIRDACPAGSPGADTILLQFDGTYLLTLSGPDD